MIKMPLTFEPERIAMRKNIFARLFVCLVAGMTLWNCGPDKKKEAAAESEKVTKSVSVPPFNADSAFRFVEEQVHFGPRVPNTPAHRKTADYLIKKLQSYGGKVTAAEFDATTFDNQRVTLRNIFASFGPEKQKRILLAAHWDTRPFADKDSLKRDAPFDGANDGASGVGVLLEIARQIGKTAPTTGVDIIFFDGEDWGEKDGAARTRPPQPLLDWWCLGSQHWARNKGSYSAYYGILLDMVGAKGAQFYREGTSLEYAPRIVEKVWNTAARRGFSGTFIKQNVDGITDDHLFVNELGKIPMIDIVQYESGAGFFGDYHHTTKDNLSLIGKETLNAVGTVLLTVVYEEE